MGAATPVGRHAPTVGAPASGGPAGLARPSAMRTSRVLGSARALVAPAGGAPVPTRPWTSVSRPRRRLGPLRAHSDVPPAAGLFDPANDLDSCGEWTRRSGARSSRPDTCRAAPIAASLPRAGACALAVILCVLLSGWQGRLSAAAAAAGTARGPPLSRPATAIPQPHPPPAADEGRWWAAGGPCATSDACWRPVPAEGHSCPRRANPAPPPQPPRRPAAAPPSPPAGVGFVGELSKQPSRRCVTDALKMLERMSHRGACGCEANTGGLAPRAGARRGGGGAARRRRPRKPCLHRRSLTSDLSQRPNPSRPPRALPQATAPASSRACPTASLAR